MADQQELQLVVSLLDNATPGLLKLKSVLQETTSTGAQKAKADLGDAEKHAKALGEHTKKTHESIKAATEHLAKFSSQVSGLPLAEFSKLAGEATKGIGGFAVALTGIPLLISAVNRELSETSKSFEALGVQAKSVGLPIGELKVASEQLRKQGYEAQQAVNTLVNLRRQVAQAQREGTPENAQFRTLFTNPDEMQAWLRRAGQASSAQQFNMTRQLLQATEEQQRQRNVAQGMNPGAAAANAAVRVNEIAQGLGLGPEWRNVTKALVDATHEELEEAKHHAEVLHELNASIEGLGVAMENAKEAAAVRLTPTMIKINDTLSHFLEAFPEAALVASFAASFGQTALELGLFVQSIRVLRATQAATTVAAAGGTAATVATGAGLLGLATPLLAPLGAIGAVIGGGVLAHELTADQAGKTMGERAREKGGGSRRDILRRNFGYDSNTPLRFSGGGGGKYDDFINAMADPNAAGQIEDRRDESSGKQRGIIKDGVFDALVAFRNYSDGGGGGGGGKAQYFAGLGGGGGGDGGGGGGGFGAGSGGGGINLPGLGGIPGLGGGGRGGGAGTYSRGSRGGGGGGGGRRRRGLGGGGGGGGDPGGDPNLTGNEFLKSQRARFEEELKTNPQVRKELAAVMTLEHESDAAAVGESLMNRMAYTGGSIHKGLHSGFYGPVNRGQLGGAIAALERNPARMARMNAAIDANLGGSNLLKGATDQGSGHDPNVNWPGGRIVRGGEVYNDWAGGPGGHEGARRFREAQQARVNTAARTPSSWGTGGAKTFTRSTPWDNDILTSPGGMDAFAGGVGGAVNVDRTVLNGEMTHRVEGTGSIDVNVSAPPGTAVKSKFGGLFKKHAVNRQTQMAPAQSGPETGATPE